MAATLAQLLTAQTVEQIFNILLGVYQANGFPVQSWQPGGTERTRLMAIATGLFDISGNYIPAATAGNFLDFADSVWLPVTAEEVYDVKQNAASFTIGDITLTAATGAGPYTYQAGQLIAIFAASGNRYINTASGTLSMSSSAAVEFIAEFPGASYSDPSSSGSLSLVSPLPGVTLTNPAGDYTDVAHVGAGTGTLTLGGSPVGPHQVSVQIDSTGASGVAAWSYSLDGSPYVSAGAVATLSDLGGTGIDVTLVDGVSGTSFVLNDTYLFNTPGSWITTQGSNIEAASPPGNNALATRCRNRWGSLSPIATNSLYELLATSTPDVGSQVVQVIVVTDTVINNKVNIVVAGPEGALPPATIATIQEYIDPRVPGTDFPVVVSPSTLDVTLAGTITAAASQLATAQGAIQTAMTNYVNGGAINATIRLSSIIELVMEVGGVVDIDSLTINGVAANLTLGSPTTFVVGLLEPLSFAYVTV